MEKPIASLYEFWGRQEVLRTHLGVLLFLVNQDTPHSHQPLELVRDFKVTWALGTRMPQAKWDFYCWYLTVGYEGWTGVCRPEEIAVMWSKPAPDKLGVKS